MQASSNGFHFFHETTNRRVAQHGVSPAGLASIAVPLYAPLVGTFQGRRVDGYALLLLGLIESASQTLPRDLTHTTHTTCSDIVRRCERILQDNAEQPITVLDLCRALRCSRRTLQTSFQRVANVTPVEYLRSIRFNAVHRLLRMTSAEELLIGDAACRWGFTHLGYFAREYRDLFGELPSQTPRLS